MACFSLKGLQAGKEDASRQQRLFGQFIYLDIFIYFPQVPRLGRSISVISGFRKRTPVWQQSTLGSHCPLFGLNSLRDGISLYHWYSSLFSGDPYRFLGFSLASKPHVEVSRMSFTLRDHNFNLVFRRRQSTLINLRLIKAWGRAELNGNKHDVLCVFMLGMLGLNLI